MRSVVHHLSVQTHHDTEVIDITERVKEIVAAEDVTDGLVLVMTLHTTTAITVNEGLEDLEDDIVEMITRLAPEGRDFRHARFLHSDGQMAVNAPSHLKGALLGMQFMAPIEHGRIVLGARHTIYLVELDGPLERQFVVQVLGE